MLEFLVEKQIVSRKDETRVVSDSRNYLKASFEMSDEWTEGTVALFGYGGECYSVLLDGECCCMIPAEVIKPPFFTVSVFCGGDALVTSNQIKVDVEGSGFGEGKSPETPAPDLWEQYMIRMKSLIASGIPYVGENRNWFIYNPEKEQYEDSGVKALGDTPVRGKDYWTDEDKTEIRSYVEDAILGGEW